MKKKVHIIAHTHWDREWYLPYEAHHMRLVELFDDLLEIFETDPEFHSFHLDGQTIGLDDYLEVRPEKREILKKYVQNGKLKIGPFYILQDAFLTSSESNARNALIGFEESKKWGVPVQLGYFPDTFGNPGQIPQLMKQMGLDVAAFGRGVKPTGLKSSENAQGMQGSVTGGEEGADLDERYSSPYSEMYWKGADGTEILGVLFANWYSNGNEIPANHEEAKEFWDRKLEDASQFASTRHLLMMNGCDHQPLQKDLTAAINVARQLYPEIEFVHTDFDTYLAEMSSELPEDLTTVEGELKSQETEGWYTLANCASSRIYLKQWNTKVARQLENITEPLATMAYETAESYPHDQLRYAWKKYMQNHPHDSICGCSVDDVHAGMMTRFKDAYEVGKYVADQAAHTLLQKIDTSKFPAESKPFVVFNTSGSTKTGTVEIEIEIDRVPFSAAWPPVGYRTLKEKGFPNFKVVDKNQKSVLFEIVKQEVKFGYDLPKDKFRQPYMGRFVTVKLHVDSIAAMSWESFALIETDVDATVPTTTIDGVENEFLKVTINPNGTLSILNKETDLTYNDLLIFENVGDVGNEYIFKQPNDTEAILSTEFETKVSEITKSATGIEAHLETTMMIPISAEDTLHEEQMAMFEFRQRRSKRHETLAPLTIKTKLILENGSRQLKFETTFDNQMKDHRLRVLFPTDINSSTHIADSIYETVVRPNGVSTSWANPTNPQHQHAFSSIYDENHGVTVSNYGLNEYELLEDRSTIAVTILRATGELGDWGYFPTPEAQCLGESAVQYAIAFHGAAEASRLRTYRDAQNYQIPFSAYQTDVHDGELNMSYQYLKPSGDAFLLTAMKRKEGSDEIITRGYNLTTATQAFRLEIDGLVPKVCNLLEEQIEADVKDELAPAEIVSYIWSKIKFSSN